MLVPRSEGSLELRARQEHLRQVRDWLEQLTAADAKLLGTSPTAAP